MTKYCSNCGAELDDNVKFCSECGSQVDKKKDAPKKTVIVEEIDEKEYKKKNQSFDENVNKTTNTIKNNNLSSNFDLTELIIESVIALLISTVIGIIVLAITWGTIGGNLIYGYDSGLTWLSFPLGVFIVAGFFGFLKEDKISAGVIGFIIGLLTSLFEGSAISLIWGGRIAQIFSYLWGNQALILIIIAPYMRCIISNISSFWHLICTPISSPSLSSAS